MDPRRELLAAIALRDLQFLEQELSKADRKHLRNAIIRDRTLLMHALIAEKWDAAQLLISLGADVGYICTPMMLDGHDFWGTHLTRLLHLEKPGSFDIEKAFTLLLAHKADANETDKGGSTVLMHAAASGHLGAVRALIAHDARINQHNKTGETALHCAARMGHYEIACELLQAGAIFDCIDNTGRTPLHIAYSSRLPNAALVELLSKNRKLE